MIKKLKNLVIIIGWILKYYKLYHRRFRFKLLITNSLILLNNY